MLLSIQNDLQILLYRYLSCQADTRAGEEQGPELAVSLMGLSQVLQLSPSQHRHRCIVIQDMGAMSPSQVAATLISLVDQVHDCADIMQNRSLGL